MNRIYKIGYLKNIAENILIILLILSKN